jgi:hypothetical protein
MRARERLRDPLTAVEHGGAGRFDVERGRPEVDPEGRALDVTALVHQHRGVAPLVDEHDHDIPGPGGARAPGE